MRELLKKIKEKRKFTADGGTYYYIHWHHYVLTKSQRVIRGLWCRSLPIVDGARELQLQGPRALRNEYASTEVGIVRISSSLRLTPVHARTYVWAIFMGCLSFSVGQLWANGYGVVGCFLVKCGQSAHVLSIHQLTLKEHRPVKFSSTSTIFDKWFFFIWECHGVK